MGSGGAEKSLVTFVNMIPKDWLVKNKVEIELMVTNDEGLFCDQIPSYIRKIKSPLDYRIYSRSLKKSLILKEITFIGILQKIFWFITNITISKFSKLSKGERQWKYYGRFLKTLDKSYDIAIAYFHSSQTYYILDKVVADKKIVWIHNEYEKLGFNDNFERNIYSRADIIVTISNRCVQSFLKHFPEFESKVRMIENITSKFIITEMAKKCFPKEYQAYISIPKIISIGRLSYQKGFDLGISAVSLLKSKGVQFHWFIIGVGELESELKKQIVQEKVEDYVSFIGLRNNPYIYIQNADIFFQPSRFEGKSVALDEAMILEKPILATKYDTVYDSINENVNGLLCDLKPESISNGLEKLINDKNLRKQLGEQLSNEDHGNDSEIEKYLDLII